MPARDPARHRPISSPTRAKGTPVERFQLTPDQAFQMLARVSMESRAKVRDVAEHVVRTRELLPR